MGWFEVFELIATFVLTLYCGFCFGCYLTYKKCAKDLRGITKDMEDQRRAYERFIIRSANEEQPEVRFH